MTRKSLSRRDADSVLNPLTLQSEMRIAALVAARRAAAAAARSRPPRPTESRNPVADVLALYGTDLGVPASWGSVPPRPPSPLFGITADLVAPVRQAAQQLRANSEAVARARAADTIAARISPAEARLLQALGGSGRVDRYGIRHFDNPALTPDPGDQTPNWPGTHDAPSPGPPQTDEFGGHLFYTGNSEAPRPMPVADSGPPSPITANPSFGGASSPRESAGFPSATALASQLSTTAPRFIPAAATMAMPAFGNSMVVAPAAGGGLSAGDALAGLAPWAVAGATGFLTGMFAFMPHSPGPQSGTIPGPNLNFTYHPDEGRLTVQHTPGPDGQPGSVVAELRIGSDGKFQTPDGQAAAIRNPDGSFRFDGGFLAGAASGRMASPVPPSIESYPATPESGPHIETYPARPPLSGPQTETFPALPPPPPAIETFPADSTRGMPHIESFPVPSDLNELNAVFATAIPNAQGGLDVTLNYHPDLTPEERLAADQKVAALHQATPVWKVPTSPRGRSAADLYRDDGGGVIPANSDIDHTIDLQIGGRNDRGNLAPLSSRVNRSLGAQLSQIFRRYPGARIDSFRISD